MAEDQGSREPRWGAAVEVAGAVALLALVMLVVGEHRIAAAAAVAAAVIMAVGLVGRVTERDR